MVLDREKSLIGIYEGFSCLPLHLFSVLLKGFSWINRSSFVYLLFLWIWNNFEETE